jgi:hypothetical protein
MLDFVSSGKVVHEEHGRQQVAAWHPRLSMAKAHRSQADVLKAKMKSRKKKRRRPSLDG